MDIVTAGLRITDEGVVCGVDVCVAINYKKFLCHCGQYNNQ